MQKRGSLRLKVLTGKVLVKKLLKIFYYFLLIIGLLYTIRICTLSHCLIQKMKIGGADEQWMKYLYYSLLFFANLVYLLKTKGKLRYFFFALSIIIIAVFIYGRYIGILLPFEEYVGKF